MDPRGTGRSNRRPQARGIDPCPEGWIHKRGGGSMHGEAGPGSCGRREGEEGKERQRQREGSGRGQTPCLAPQWAAAAGHRRMAAAVGERPRGGAYATAT